MTLKGPRRPAASGQASSLVIFLHGYGADGNDLLGLAEPLAEYLPDTMFLAPDAPQKSVANPFGRQWFPIPYIDGSTQEQAMSGMAAAVSALNDWLDQTARETGIGPDRTVLVGFSQGTMMALHVAPRRPQALAGVVGFSGRLLAPEHLAGAVKSRPPMLLIHGDQDQVVPPESTPQAAEALRAAGFDVDTHVSKGMAHGIAPDGLGLALQFIQRVLPAAE